jgi:hypothetical protein
VPCCAGPRAQGERVSFRADSRRCRRKSATQIPALGCRGIGSLAFFVGDNFGQKLTYVYFEEEPWRPQLPPQKRSSNK